MKLPKNRKDWTKEHKDYYWKCREAVTKPKWKNDRSGEVGKTRSLSTNPNITSTQKSRKYTGDKQSPVTDVEITEELRVKYE